MTPEEKAAEAWHYFARQEYGPAYLVNPKTFNARGYKKERDLFLSLFTQTIREAGPREVSDEDIANYALDYAMPLREKVQNIELAYAAGFSEALSMNATMKLESLFPSVKDIDDEASVYIYDDSGYYCFRSGCDWIRNRLFGDKK